VISLTPSIIVVREIDMAKFAKGYVTCKCCKEEHEIKKVRTINIEEDMQGRDVVSFECPKCKALSNSLVYVR
jgi:hypothetical protein